VLVGADLAEAASLGLTSRPRTCGGIREASAELEDILTVAWAADSLGYLTSPAASTSAFRLLRPSDAAAPTGIRWLRCPSWRYYGNAEGHNIGEKSL